MAEYPNRITVGLSPYQVVYQLQGDQLLLRFHEEVGDEQIEELLRAQKLQARSADSLPRSVDTLQADNMRWVMLSEVHESLSDYARSLVGQHPEVVAAMPVYYAEDQGPETAASPVPDVLVVQLKESERRKTLGQLKRLGLEHNKQASDLLKPFYYFTLEQVSDDPQAEEGDVFALLDQVAELPGVELVEFDWLKLETYLLVPSDTFWANQWNMTQIGMVNAWNVQTGNAGVWVAIIDSGFDLAHPDLTFTPNTGATLTHFNAVQALAGNPPPYNAGPGGVRHGTAVAGLAAATLNNAAGVAGVAGGCTIMPVRLSAPGNLKPTAAKVAAGINWAAANGARVGNLSLTTVGTAAATTAVANAWTAGMVLCAATGNLAGNTTSPAIGFPANHANSIAVGASDQADQRKRPASADGECWGSQFGPQIDVVAPGVVCWSTDEQAGNGYNNNNGGAINWACVNYPSSGDAAGNYIAVFNGTSAATPHVTGLAALLFSQYPTLTNQQVRDIIERTCSKVNSGLYPYAHSANRPNGTWHQQMGHGRINCNAALRYADLLITDHNLDTGAVPSSELVGGSWTPKNFWSYQPYVTTTDQPAALPADHEPALAGQNNYVHALVTNLGPATATNIQVTWHMTDYPGTQFIWPTDWNAGNQIASASIPSLAPGASQPIQAVWLQALVNVAAGYVHPCMLVKAVCNRDIGGDLGDYVYEYNNIAQHNISFGSFSSAMAGAARAFTLPFAVGHPVSRARRATLLFDLSRANGAAVFLDVDPGTGLPYIDRILDVTLKDRPKGSSADGCGVRTLDDTKLLLECCGCRAEVLLKAGSVIRLGCDEATRRIELRDLALRGATPVTREGKVSLLLEGPLASVDLPLIEGQVVPMAVTAEVPGDAPAGTRFRIDVTQLSEGKATGGVSLDVEAR